MVKKFGIIIACSGMILSSSAAIPQALIGSRLYEPERVVRIVNEGVNVLKGDLKFGAIDANDRLLEAAVVSDESSLDYAILGC